MSKADKHTARRHLALSFTHGDTNGSSMRISNCVWRIKKRVMSDTTDNHITQQGNPSEVVETAQNVLQGILPSSSQGKDVCNVYITFDVLFQKK
jgi:hypothetical protein